jgi:hypothetical protein
MVQRLAMILGELSSPLALFGGHGEVATADVAGSLNPQFINLTQYSRALYVKLPAVGFAW